MFAFREKGHLYANCLFYILIIYCKYILFRFLSGGIRMQIPILTEVQQGRTIFEKDVCGLKKECFLCLFCEIKITFMPIVCFVF